MEAIILAGGRGTRLNSVVSNVPKPLAPINSQPFLTFLLRFLTNQNVQRVILATGYQHDKIETVYGSHQFGVKIQYSVETEPLGTGGAIRKALDHISDETIFVLNGDSYFHVDLALLAKTHKESNADLTMALKPMKAFSRYGAVKMQGSRIVSFEEKKAAPVGHINGGVYCMKTNIFDACDLSQKFSFEDEFLRKQVSALEMHGFVSEGYFIDIGIPEDYERAQLELQHYV